MVNLMSSELILLFVILPLAGAFLIPVIGRFIPVFSKILTALIFFILTAICILAIFQWDRSTIVYSVGGWEPVNDVPIGIHLVFDGFSAFVLGIISLIALLSSVYAGGYITKYTSENNFYALFCLMVAGMNGVVLTGDLFNLFVFLEIAAIAS